VHNLLCITARLSRTPASVRAPAPDLGHDTADVLHSLLGLSGADIEALTDSGAIFDPARSRPATTTSAVSTR
jgi:crotonobetainyl-CoA:carnitine CoA-transferase CaiB-like acyl-CoA transferase